MADVVVSASTLASASTAAPVAAPVAAPAEGKTAVEEFISPEEFAKLSSKKVKRVIDGKEEILTLGEIEKGYGHSKAANKRFEEAAELRKQVAADKAKLESELSKLKDPKAVRQVLKEYLGEEGFSNLAHETVAEAFRRERMTPEQIQAEQEKRELEEFRNSKKQREEEAKKSQYEKEVEHHSNKLTSDLQALSTKIGRNIHPHEMETLLSLLSKSLEAGMDLSLDEAWAYTHKTENERFARYLQQLDVDTLPKEVIEKIRKKSVETLPFQAGRKADNGVSSSPNKKDSGIDGRDFFNLLRKK